MNQYKLRALSDIFDLLDCFGIKSTGWSARADLYQSLRKWFYSDEENI